MIYSVEERLQEITVCMDHMNSSDPAVQYKGKVFHLRLS